LFSDKPHLCLQENFWDAANGVAIERTYIIDAATGEVRRNSSSTQAYSNEGYRSLLAESGFGEVVFYPCLGERAGSPQDDLMAILTQKVET